MKKKMRLPDNWNQWPFINLRNAALAAYEENKPPPLNEPEAEYLSSRRKEAMKWLEQHKEQKENGR